MFLHFQLTRVYFRVNLLQRLWRDTNGYLIHPAIGTHNESIKVADVGTATGFALDILRAIGHAVYIYFRLWLCELENEAPGSHQLYGFDISADSFIAAEHLPGNMELKVVDASKPPPEELRGQFDIVHVRLLQSVIVNDDPEWVIAHCMELLRPGGYLQWEEFDPMGTALHKRNGKAESLQTLIEISQSRVPARLGAPSIILMIFMEMLTLHSWIEALPKRIENQGGQIVAVERKSELAYHHTTMTYIFCLVFEEYANVYLDIHGPPGSGDAIRKLAQDGFGEALNGSYASHLFQTVVARKV